MSIQVKFISPISAVTGMRQVDLDPVHRTVGEVLDELTRQYPALKNELFNEEGKLDYLYQVILNDEMLEWSKARDELVKDGDRLAIITLLGGG